MDKVTCRATLPLNICDEREVNALASTLNCLALDVYEAVAFVGDRRCCIRSHIERHIARDVSRQALIKLRELPPVWKEDAPAVARAPFSSGGDNRSSGTTCVRG